MAQDNMVLFAKKLKLESRWNELFLENKGQITPEMSVLGDEIKTVIRSSLKNKKQRSTPILEMVKFIFTLVN
jgi:hypothetical protein